MAGDVINLNHARKVRARAADKAAATQNRALHGQTKGEKAKTLSLAEAVKKALDSARRDPPGGKA